MKLSKRKIELMLVDIAIIIGVYYMTNFIRILDLHSIVLNGELNLTRLAALVIMLMTGRILCGVYRNVWRYANIETYLTIMVSDFISNMILMLIGRVWFAVNLGIGVHMIVAMAILLVTLLSRYCYQLLYAYRSKNADKTIEGNSINQIYKVEAAIVGAGNVGATLADEFFRNPRSRYVPVCFIDTDPEKIGQTVNGVPIYSEDNSTANLLKRMKVQEIIIALPDLTVERKQRLYERYRRTGCPVKIYDYPSGAEEKSTAKRTLRDFRIEDLLFRDPIEVENPETKAFYAGKTVLVTGGGGSIGSELCRQIAALQPKKLVILDIYENNAYDVQQELIRKYGDKLNLEVIIASVRDVERLEHIFRDLRPEIVFHAAAHKHVPLMEHSGVEALKNNVLGTYNVAEMSEKYGVEKFLLISTDKAVNPTNVMGASKRLCEMVIQCRENSKTEFTAVRFGNVLGSNGSVIPLFKRQIEAGGPVTLTDKRIIRYFMTIPEAVQLVMVTCAMAHNGELFVLDMGKPVKILDLAENMIRLSGFTPYKDIDIVEIGLRPGEKLYEELLMKTEELDKTSNDMIFIERDKGLPREEVERKLDLVRQAIETEEQSAVLEVIRKTVPTYHDPAEINGKADQARETAAANE
ncbi:nucleoside-diphosphate sugar epimerase/dehydratase [Vescimonas sp.]|uniref:polysaccharide biosynthesis protein n=1 Tax=Vescimonas sp. TaxID=2892404 RepID=UPI00307C5D99